MKTSHFFFLIPVIALSLGGCSSFQKQVKTEPTPIPVVTEAAGVVTEGRLTPHQYINLSFNTGGIVGEVLVAEGDSVQKGQPLARLDQREQFATAVASAELELVNAQVALKKLNENTDVNTSQSSKKVADARDALREAERRLTNLKAGGQETDINSASANVVILKDKLDKAQKDFNSYENKPSDNLKRAEYLSKLADAQKKYDNAVRLLNNLQGSASEIDMAIAEANLELAKANLAFQEQEYEKVKAGPNPDDLATAQARVKSAETALAAAQAAYDDSELKAPFSAQIAKVNYKVGELAAPGQPAMVLADFSQWIVETDDLTEIEVPEVKIGDPANVTFDALPGLTLSGVVESIGGIYEEKRGDVTYTARVRLTEDDPRLRWGMTAVANIQK